MIYKQHSNQINVGFRNKAKSLVGMFNKELLNFSCTKSDTLAIVYRM